MTVQHVFVNPAGQDDNLGDSALRAGLLRALDTPGVQLHVHLEAQSSDYLAGIPLSPRDIFYESRPAWLTASRETVRPIYIVNAGEINPHPDRPYPLAGRAAELRSIADRGGVIIAAGMGLKHPTVAHRVEFDPALRDASIVSWRDHGSRDAAGFGDAAPDWAFALGTDVSSWIPPTSRTHVAVTLRFDRPWPDTEWFDAVRAFAERTETRIVTLAQVARDAPRAVRLAEELEAEFLMAPSTSHDDLDAHVRAVYATCLAVVSDRAHALIMGATEGAYPIGTAVDAQKLHRLLDTADVGRLTGTHDDLATRTVRLESALPGLAPAIDSSRQRLDDLTARIRTVIHG
ncbi:polysaccharide pyruvyl transferase family protein [Microbacterium resistens]|uniref:Polysaccharide pyruvyl transferase family protein n=1 Tax=Microbacterium resistens TaxID=156977 RepID=A0ABY3RVB6_9MICO|nr:polysaccharide pyruvyl transferase family protein [Microbacterium resistens]UGS26392.1 polysaccharide pyruvyl transferase family protein [Microbacterium resistens]